MDLYSCIGNHTFQQWLHHCCSTGFANNEKEQNFSIFQKYNITLELLKEFIMQLLASRIPDKKSRQLLGGNHGRPCLSHGMVPAPQGLWGHWHGRTRRHTLGHTANTDGEPLYQNAQCWWSLPTPKTGALEQNAQLTGFSGQLCCTSSAQAFQ